MRSKVHKRRLKRLEEPAYTAKEAEAAAGLGTYVAPVKQPVPEPLAAEMVAVSQFVEIQNEELRKANHAVPDM